MHLSEETQVNQLEFFGVCHRYTGLKGKWKMLRSFWRLLRKLRANCCKLVTTLKLNIQIALGTVYLDYYIDEMCSVIHPLLKDRMYVIRRLFNSRNSLYQNSRWVITVSVDQCFRNMRSISRLLRSVWTICSRILRHLV